MMESADPEAPPKPNRVANDGIEGPFERESSALKSAPALWGIEETDEVSPGSPGAGTRGDSMRASTGPAADPSNENVCGVVIGRWASDLNLAISSVSVWFAVDS